jgi:N-acetylglucosamine kinase-like BadF-type ATPase
MISAVHRDVPIVAGVDLGGTWVRAVFIDAHGHVRQVRRRVTAVPDLGSFLLTSMRRSAGRRLAALVMASRGVWTRVERQRVSGHLRGVAKRIVVISDAQGALLGALGGRPGLLVLAGTGSIVLGRDARGRWARAGGLGPLLGDEGSAFWLGRAWLRATTPGEDFMPARRLVQSPDPVGGIAALAPSVLRRARRGNRLARAIVQEGQAELAALAFDVARRLRLPQPIDVSWAGSVMGDATYRRGVARALARLCVRARWREPAMEPVMAAAHLAARLAASKSGPLIALPGPAARRS